MITDKHERIESLNFVKGIVCIGIILIHCKFPGIFGNCIRTLAKIGVPFFFMVSGFFSLYGTNLTVDRMRMCKKIKHVFNLLLGSGFFYLMFHLLVYCLLGKSSPLSEFYRYVTIDKVVRFFVTNSPFIYSHLWFVMALMYCYFVEFVIGNRIKGKWKIYYIIISLTIFTLLSETLPSVGFPKTIPLFGIGLYNIFLLRALPFYLLGGY